MECHAKWYEENVHTTVHCYIWIWLPKKKDGV
jgi:hypothetical protein